VEAQVNHIRAGPGLRLRASDDAMSWIGSLLRVDAERVAANDRHVPYHIAPDSARWLSVTAAVPSSEGAVWRWAAIQCASIASAG
jgi:hypothetical protein